MPCISEPNKRPLYDSGSPAKLIHGCFKGKELITRKYGGINDQHLCITALFTIWTS
ncbi:hypothetical protein B7P43_G12627 [Cryptotermes secundus]|uniref:Uncharacterized protein n=1 Tax=Cryptotermes secundus TaxID=105785 RepID=A0A2J7QKN5_9NEOP|nr:hypothetical protein B7P43_G12627 [Cryptotermes secundus]